MSLRIRVQIIGGNDTVIEGQNDMKYIEFFQKIQAYLSSNNELRVTKNTSSLILNRDRNKTLQDLEITNNCCLQVEIIPETLYILAKYGGDIETIEINDSEMKLPEFVNLVKNRFRINENVEIWQENTANSQYKKCLDPLSQAEFSLKALNFTNSTTVKLLKDEMRIMLEVNGEVCVFETKKNHTFEMLNKGICEKLRMSRVDCIFQSRRLGVQEDGNKTLEEIGLKNNSKLVVVDHVDGGFYSFN